MRKGRHRKHPLRTYKVSGRRQHRAAGFNTIDAPISTGIRGTFRDRPTIKRKLCAQLYSGVGWMTGGMWRHRPSRYFFFFFFFQFFTCPSLSCHCDIRTFRGMFFFSGKKTKKKRKKNVRNEFRLKFDTPSVRGKINLKLEAKIELDWNFFFDEFRFALDQSRWTKFWIRMQR